MLPSIKKEVTDIGLFIRERVSEYAQEFQDELLFCSDTLSGACAFSSVILADVLDQLNMFASVEVVEVISGTGSHCAVLVDGGYFIDITATQFDPANDEVYIGLDFEDHGPMFPYLCENDEETAFVYYGNNRTSVQIVGDMIDIGWDQLNLDDIDFIVNSTLSHVWAKKVA